MPLYYREYSDKIILYADGRIFSSELQLKIYIYSKDGSIKL